MATPITSSKSSLDPVGAPPDDLSWHTGPRRASLLVMLVASLLGVLGYLWPFLLPLVGQEDEVAANGSFAPILLAVVTGLCLAAMLVELSGSGVRPTKTVALVGVLVAINAALRLLPSFLGASPVFLLIMLTGASFGAAIGFQMGALSLLVSAFLTGGVGPWLPYQMLGAGWVGLLAGLLPKFEGRPRLRVYCLAGYGIVAGLAFGALLNLSFWPFTTPGAEEQAGLYWVPGMSFHETVTTYAKFYLATSLPFDISRAVANAILVLVLGRPLLHVFDRYRARFMWELDQDAGEATLR